MKNVKDFKAIKAVYSYYFPEVRRVLHEIPRSEVDDTLMKSINPGLDDFHIPIIKKFIKLRKSVVPAFKDFKWWYPTSGSSEGIFHFLNYLKERPNTHPWEPSLEKIYTSIGEYEGYGEYAKTLGLGCDQTPMVTNNVWFNRKKVIYFLSNPSAVDGKIIPNDVINEFLDEGHKVFYDLAYLGSTRKYKFDLSHPNIVGGCVSFSKPYGLFYHRVGFTFSKTEIPSLYGNKWFKNIYSLMLVDKLLSDVVGTIPNYLHHSYRKTQTEIVDDMNRHHDLNIEPCDALLLGYIRGKGPRELKKFRRGNGYRLCLTPYYEQPMYGGRTGSGAGWNWPYCQ